ncbi:MAG: response regulator [Myxococcota bacterium]
MPPAKRRLICLEPDRELADELRLALDRRGFQVDVAVDGATTLELLAEALPDAVLLAAELPSSQSGFAICNRFKKNADWKRVPVIVASGKPSAIEDHKKLKWRADAYLAHPISLPDLLQALDTLLGGNVADEPDAAESATISLDDAELSIVEELTMEEGGAPDGVEAPIGDADIESEVAALVAPEIDLLDESPVADGAFGETLEEPRATVKMPSAAPRTPAPGQGTFELREALDLKDRQILDLQVALDRKDREIADQRAKLREAERAARELEARALAVERARVDADQSARGADARHVEEIESLREAHARELAERGAAEQQRSSRAAEERATLSERAKRELAAALTQAAAEEQAARAQAVAEIEATRAATEAAEAKAVRELEHARAMARTEIEAAHVQAAQQVEAARAEARMELEEALKEADRASEAVAAQHARELGILANQVRAKEEESGRVMVAAHEAEAEKAAARAEIARLTREIETRDEAMAARARDAESVRQRSDELEAQLAQQQEEVVRAYQRAQLDDRNAEHVRRALAITIALIERRGQS